MHRTQEKRYPPIADYALISDCHCSALISRAGSVDWCCMPRVDDDSCFGRLLDWERGGYCQIAPTSAEATSCWRYVPGTMILETHFTTGNGEARILDFFAMDCDNDALESPAFDLVRLVEGIAGEIDMCVKVCPRFDYGEVMPRMRRHPVGAYTATGSNKGLIIHADMPLEIIEHRDLRGSFRIRAGQRSRLAIKFESPELIEHAIAGGAARVDTLDRHYEDTQRWWSEWSRQIRAPYGDDPHTLRSTIILKALTFERTGAIIAAATASLPEWIGGERNWDYRFSWIRDSVFTIRALNELGYVREANRFHRFIQRSSAGSAEQLQIMYGVDGKRRLTEVELCWLEGYAESKPVRIGNRAASQTQLDIYGELLEMAWESHVDGHPTEPDYWQFLLDVINTVCRRWPEKDHGIWEVRGSTNHYVHSKVMCWAALNRGVMLAKAKRFDAPVADWIRHREALREAIEIDGYDRKRGIFVQAFGSRELDAALLMLPRVGFISYRDPRMLRTTDAICSELSCEGLLRRYKSDDGLRGREGIFLPCTFWLVSCLASQGRRARAMRYYERALGCANDLGLFSEEYDVEGGQMLGNFPQGLTHVSQIMAKLALDNSSAEERASK